MILDLLAQQLQGASSAGLWSMLDSDGDGSVVDDVAGMLGKFLK